MPAGRSALLLILALALPALALVASLPEYPMILGVLNNAAHAPVFGAQAVVLLLLIQQRAAWPAWIGYGSAFMLAIATGAAIELIQPALGRGAELADLRTDALGAAGGLALVAIFSAQRRWLGVMVLAVTAGAVLWPVAEASLAYWQRMHQFPALLEMSSQSDWYFIRSSGLEVATGALPDRWRRNEDPPSLRLRITGRHWPGVTHAEPEPDWRGYSRLMMDLTNPDERPLTLTVRVHDRSHDNRKSDRFNETFTLPPGTRSVHTFPLAAIAQAPADRVLDLSAIAGLILFGGNEPDLAGREFYLTRIWLE